MTGLKDLRLENARCLRAAGHNKGESPSTSTLDAVDGDVFTAI